MGKKAHPKAVRLAINETWSSRWFQRIAGSGLAKYKENLKEDYALRVYLDKKLRHASVNEVDIKRSPKQLTVVIKTARPGLIIGKGGKDIDILKKDIINLVSANNSVKIDIEEVRKPETRAKLIAQNIADQIERRFPYRRAMKKTLEKIIIGNEIKGVKIKVAGRLNGADIARSEGLSKGTIPLQTFSAKIDYYQEVARTTYGAIGIKVWVYRDDSFKD